MAIKKQKRFGPAIMGNNSLRCIACGEELRFPESDPPGRGYSIGIISALCKAFDKEHKGHKPTDAGAARYRYSNPDEWFKSWDTGTSSLAIYATLSGKPVASATADPPRDVGDFGRCRRLMRVAPPEWTERLTEVAERRPAWSPLVYNWAELTALYDEEIGADSPPLTPGEAPKLYARLKELRGETP
jgi:hypothetical protein